ncbi:MAG TPA: NAD-dependent epimerase/dehydratase family protein [Streptosporangiaceae bacterium]|jgi:UDP-glucose 4-epimerase|nr:NAD-dependent epimerase/dehydratase family protein [Streptosporangiaceae bacterium]
MQVAVIGGGGFIGSHVVDHLVAADHQVRVIDPDPRWRNPAAHYHELDLFDDAGLAGALAGCRAVFHLAGASDVNDVAADPVAAVRLNVEGTARVLECARQQGCERVLLASTVWVYGATAGNGERTEEATVDLARAGHVYVSTKLAAELLVHSYREMYGQRYTILRYGIPYGPRMRDVLVVARFVRAALEGRPITIAGTGEQQRNYVYVGDLADAHVRALSVAAADQVLALEGGTPVSVREIADTVRELIGPVPVEHMPARTADYQGVTVSNRRAKELLDWSPETTFAVGVRRYLDWLGLAGEAGPGNGHGPAGTDGPAGRP